MNFSASFFVCIACEKMHSNLKARVVVLVSVRVRLKRCQREFLVENTNGKCRILFEETKQFKEDICQRADMA